MNLSCTSVMLPRWTLDETFDKLAEYGYDGVELRCRYNPKDRGAEPSFWGRHLADIDPDNIVQKAAQIGAAAQRSGVRVCALAPNVLLGDDEVIDKLFRGAVALGGDQLPAVRIGAARHQRDQPYLPQFEQVRSGYAQLVEKAREYGVKVLYEIHVGTVAVSCSRAFELLRDLDPAHIGAIYDVPNMLRVGLEDSRMGMEILGPYLAHVHIGNGTPVVDEYDESGRMKWKWNFSDLRQGLANIPQIIDDLKAVGYAGHISLEEFGPGDDDDKVKSQGIYLRKLIEAED